MNSELEKSEKSETTPTDGTDGTDMHRFTDPNHQNFWRSNNPYSPAFRAPRNLRELIKTIYHLLVGWF